MATLRFAATEDSTGTTISTTLTSNDVKAFTIHPESSTVIQEADPDGLIGKPLGKWGGRIVDLTIVESEETHKELLEAIDEWNDASNYKGSLTITVGTYTKTYTKMRMGIPTVNIIDPVYCHIDLQFTQEKN